MAMFHVVLLRSGPQWDPARPLEEQSGWAAHAAFMNGLVDEGSIVLGGPLSDEHRVVHVVEAGSEDEVRAAFARDPWSESHLRVGTIDSWTIRLDGRQRPEGASPRVRAFLDSYRAAFEAFDVPAIADLFSYPCQITSDGDRVEVTTVDSRENWVSRLDRLVGAYRTIGVRSAELSRLVDVELTPRLSQAAVDWRLIDADGARIYDFEASYTLTDWGDGMRINAVAHNETPRLRERLELRRPA